MPWESQIKRKGQENDQVDIGELAGRQDGKMGEQQMAKTRPISQKGFTLRVEWFSLPEKCGRGCVGLELVYFWHVTHLIPPHLSYSHLQYPTQTPPQKD